MVRSYGFREFGGYTEHHPVRLRLPPLHRRGIPPRQASPATPPQEGNCLPLRFGELGGAGRLGFCRYAMFWVEYALCQHIILCKYAANGYRELRAQAVEILRGERVGVFCMI